jgi:death-on-curing protein
MIYLTYEQVIELHDQLIQKFGGIGGIRDVGLLESALAAPMMTVFGRQVHQTLYGKAGAYLFTSLVITPFLMEISGRPPLQHWYFSESMGNPLVMM